MSYELPYPVTPAPKPVFDRQEKDEKKESTKGTPHAVNARPPPTISSIYMQRKAITLLTRSGLTTLSLILTDSIELG